MPEITERYIRIPVARRLASDRIRTITISADRGIKALYAANRKKVLTYLFARSHDWTMAKAKAWVKAHKSTESERELLMKSSNNAPQRFRISLPILKTRIVIGEDENGQEIETRFVEGVASSTDLDLQGDRMAPEAIQSMANSLKQHVINLNAEHDTSWQSELGEISKLEVTDDYKLAIEAELNRMSKSNDLWYALTELDKKLGLSVGGYVREYEMAKEGEGEGAKWVRLFKDIELDHIAVTSNPANPKTWISNISKSVTANEDKLEKKIELEDEEVEKAEWTRAFINNLPDAAFAYIEPGGKKDEEGKTKPRSLRHFPHHNMSVKSPTENSSVDKAHLRNALARAPQSPFGPKALAHLVRHAKALGIGDYEKKHLLDGFDEETMLRILLSLAEVFNDEELVKYLESNLMTEEIVKDDSSLETKEAVEETADAEVVSEDEAETKVEPETEESEEESKVDEEESKEEESEEEEAESEEEVESEEESKEEESEEEETKGEEAEETEESEEEVKADEEESDEEKESDTKEESEDESEKKEEAEEEVAESVDPASDLVKIVEKAIEEKTQALQERIAELEKQPGDRKTAEITKGVGDDTSEDTNPADLKAEMASKIAEIKKDYATDPNLFSRIQRVRAEYAGLLSE